MLPFPNISPEIFSIELFGITLSLRWYAISYILGFICAITIMKYYIRRSVLWENNRPPMTIENADALLTYLIIGVIVGGRLGYVIFYNPNYYLFSPIEIIRIWDGGMAFHGGFIGVIIAVVLYCRLNEIPLWSCSDLIALSTPPGLFFGRLANFVNVELWGRPTSMPWGVIFPGARAQDCDGVIGPCARHPSQLYEAGLEGLLLFTILMFFALNGALRRPGLVTGIFAAGYGASRFFVEYFRVPDPQFLSFENPQGYAFGQNGFGFTMGQALSMPMIFFGILLIFFAYKVSIKRHEDY